MPELGVTVDPTRASQGARTIKRSLDDMAGSADRAESAVEGLQAAANGLRFDAQGRLRNSVGQYASATERARYEAERLGVTANDNYRRMAQGATVAVNGANAVRDSFVRLFALLGGAVALQRMAMGFVGMSDEATRLTGRLQLVTNSTAELADVEERLFQVSQRTRTAYASNVELYSRSAQALRDYGATQQQILQFTETLNQAFRISGATGQEASNAIIQLSQGLASGTLRGEEYNSIAEQGARVTRALADALGVGIGELRELAQTGKLTTEVVFTALLSQAPKVAEEFTRVPRTVSEAMTQLRNDMLRTVGEVNSATGSTEKLVAEIDRLRQIVTTTDFHSWMAFFARGVANVIEDMQRLYSTVSGFGDVTRAAFRDAYDGAVEWLARLVEAALEAANEISIRLSSAINSVNQRLGFELPNPFAAMDFDSAGASASILAWKTTADEAAGSAATLGGELQEASGVAGAAATEFSGLGESTEDADKKAKKATESFAAQIRSLEQNTEGLQRQISALDMTAGATAAAELRARELARAWDVAREAGMDAIPETTKTAIDNAAASVENLTNQLERLNLERGQEDAMRMLEAEARLVGMSAEARQVAMAGLEAEQRLRSQNITTTDEWGQAYIRNAQAAAGMRVEIDRQTKAYETQQQFVENVLSTSLDALFDIGSAESWGDAVMGIFADIGRQFQELAKQNLMQALFGQNYTTGQLAPGQRSIAQPGFPSGFGSVPVAANQNVPAGGAINVRAVSALNDSLQRSSRSALDVARQFDGLNERADSAVLDSFMQASGNWNNLSAADTAWCAAFANAAIAQAGGRGTDSNLASSFMNWGQGTNTPQVGDIVVLKPQARGASGHVGFVAGFGDGSVQVFGGNQSNAANTRSFGLDQVRGYRTGVGVGGAGIGGSLAMPQMAAPVYAPQMSGATQQAMAQGWSGFGPVPGQAGSSTQGWFGQGGRFGNLMQSPVAQMGMMGLGAFGSGYSSGSAGSGALSGGLTGFMTGGPVGGIVGLVGGALGGLFGGRAKRRQEHQQKAQAWEQMAPQWSAFQDEVRTGTGATSGLRASQGAMVDQFGQFVQAGSAAWKNGTNNSSALYSQVGADLGEYFARTNAEFGRAYEAQVASLNRGQGLSGPFISARDEILEAGKTLATFVDDTRVVFGDGSVEAQRAAEASIAQLRALMSGADELSEIGAAVQAMEGAAAGLHTQLEALGVSAADAGAAVSEDLTAAMGRLRGNFSQGIQDQLWSLDGKGYIAEFRQFFTDIDGAIQDALLVGADRGLVDELFVRQAQSMVNGAQLSGEAFDELIIAMPRLAGVVREFSAAAEEAAKRTADQIAALRLSYGDRVFETTIDTSTEAGSLARFDRYAAREREEEIQAGGDAILDLERALAAERGQIVKQFADRAADEMRSAIERYDDRTFAATNTDDLAAFERQISRERQEAVRLGGDALVAFERMAAAERAEVVKTQAEEARRQLQSAAQDRLASAIRNRAEAEGALRREYERTVSFVGTLKDALASSSLDPELSTLSSADRLAEAEKQWRETLALAQQNDPEAQGRLVSVTEAYRREARDFYATSERYGAINGEIDASLKGLIAKTETELDVARRQATFLQDIATGQKGLSDLVAEYMRSVQDVLRAMDGVNESRNWGANESLNRQIVDALSRQGLNYAGDFGAGGFTQWTNSLGRIEQDIVSRILAQLGAASQSGRNWGANAAYNQGLVNQLSGAGINYGGHFGNGEFQSFLASLDAAARERARSVIGFSSGGYTGGSSPFEVRGVVHGMEGVLNAPAMRGVGIPALNYMNEHHRLPDVYQPRFAANGNGDVVAEIRALRADNAELRREVSRLGDIIHASDEETRAEIGKGNRQQKKTADAAALAA